ncbi:MAG: hypothetical protein RRZ64_08085 [Rikenellaceae bacterium]
MKYISVITLKSMGKKTKKIPQKTTNHVLAMLTCDTFLIDTDVECQDPLYTEDVCIDELPRSGGEDYLYSHVFYIKIEVDEMSRLYNLYKFFESFAEVNFFSFEITRCHIEDSFDS